MISRIRYCKPRRPYKNPLCTTSLPLVLELPQREVNGYPQESGLQSSGAIAGGHPATHLGPVLRQPPPTTSLSVLQCRILSNWRMPWYTEQSSFTSFDLLLPLRSVRQQPIRGNARGSPNCLHMTLLSQLGSKTQFIRSHRVFVRLIF